VLAYQQLPKNGHRTSFSYLAARRQIPTQTDVYKLYSAFFPPLPGPGDPAADEARARRRLAQRRSALDLAAGDLRTLAGRLPPAERAKLDAHATALRELEGRLSLHVVAPPGSACADRRPRQTGLDPADEQNVAALCTLMLDFVAAATACNLARIVTFPLGVCGSSWRYSWLGIDRDGHEIAHEESQGSPEIAALRVRIGRWHAEQVAALARALDAIPEGNGTVLDNSLLVWTNENANGSHGLEDIPVVLVGRAGGRLARTGRLVDEGPQLHQCLATSVLGLMGAPAPGFGDQPDCGPLAGLA
jgi:Protein of unknown function (DUF1552)